MTRETILTDDPCAACGRKPYLRVDGTGYLYRYRPTGRIVCTPRCDQSEQMFRSARVMVSPAPSGVGARDPLSNNGPFEPVTLPTRAAPCDCPECVASRRLRAKHLDSFALARYVNDVEVLK